MPDQPESGLPARPQQLVVRSLTPTPDPFAAQGEATLFGKLELSKAVREVGTETGTEVGARGHLINKTAAREMRRLNTTHSACLDAQRQSSVGMGHRDLSIYDALDPLCRFGWQDVLDACGDDFGDTGDAFIEAVWDEGRTQLLGINQLDGNDVHVVVERQNNSEEYHYQVTSGSLARETVAMAPWGEMLALRERYQSNGGMVRNGLTIGDTTTAPLGGRIVNSEVIHFRRPTSRDPYQGYPDWVSAVPQIELSQAIVRHEFDFHFNRGVPELLATFIGHTFNDDDWNAIKALFLSNQGPGNSRKTAAIQIPGTPETVKVQVDKLALDNSQDFFEQKSMALASAIATAHGTPPLLAGINLPGKIGAANEGPNSLLLFQKRKLGQIQRLFSRVLAATIGDGSTPLAQVKGGAKTLKAEQFLGKKYEGKQIDPETQMPIYHEAGNGFKTVLDGMTLGAQDTMARMKEPMAGSGRNPEDGLLGGADDRKDSDPKKSR